MVNDFICIAALVNNRVVGDCFMHDEDDESRR